MSLTVKQLRDKLDLMIKEDPQIAHKPVVAVAYDTENANKRGYEFVEGVEHRYDHAAIV